MLGFIGGLGMQELIIVLVILLLLFGSTRLPQLARGMGKSIKEFKKGINDVGGDEAEPDDARRAQQLRASETTARTHDDELAPDKFPVNKPR
jgi:sec-independent protein translocase protein TatA